MPSVEDWPYKLLLGSKGIGMRFINLFVLVLCTLTASCSKKEAPLYLSCKGKLSIDIKAETMSWDTEWSAVVEKETLRVVSSTPEMVYKICKKTNEIVEFDSENCNQNPLGKIDLITGNIFLQTTLKDRPTSKGRLNLQCVKKELLKN
jgi:hypothetical protein